MTIPENIALLMQSVPENVTVVAVSKLQPVSAIMQAYSAGLRIFGENKVQELVSKHPKLPQDIEWHFIGHLQSNKVKQIAPFVRMIHSIDSLALLCEVDREAGKYRRVIDCLLQYRIATEATKFGMRPDEVKELLESEQFGSLNNIRIAGVMGMATFSDDEELVLREFRLLYHHFLTLKKSWFPAQESFNIVSMGMSGDYHLAIEAGSTMIRIGTGIFGERSY